MSKKEKEIPYLLIRLTVLTRPHENARKRIKRCHTHVVIEREEKCQSLLARNRKKKVIKLVRPGLVQNLLSLLSRLHLSRFTRVKVLVVVDNNLERFSLLLL